MTGWNAAGEPYKPDPDPPLADRMLALLRRMDHAPLRSSDVERELGIADAKDHNRKVRLAFENLCMRGERVCAEPAVGFWVARTPAEMDAYASWIQWSLIKPLTERMHKIHDTAVEWKKEIARAQRKADRETAKQEPAYVDVDDGEPEQGDLFGGGVRRDYEYD